MSGGQRIPNLPQEAWTPEAEALFPLMSAPGSAVRGSDFNSILVLAQHPELANPYLHFNAALARGVDLSPRLKEIAILRTAWRRLSEYEWVHHAISGARIGLTAEQLEQLMQDTVPEGFTPEERAVIAATDDICLSGGVTDTTWPALSAALNTREVMELLFVVGCYILLAAILNTSGAPVEAHVAEKFEGLGLPHLKNIQSQAV